jgi:hypothetical protein
MTKAGSEGDQYLREYPHLKWINQCAACQHRGRRPEKPAEIFPGVAAQYLKAILRRAGPHHDLPCLGRAVRSANVGIARWTLPVWLYVSVAGVVVYWMLYRL